MSLKEDNALKRETEWLGEYQRWLSGEVEELPKPVSHPQHADAIRGWLMAIKERDALYKALLRMTSEPSDLVYPELDANGLDGSEEQNGDDDSAAPLWTEAGLYGRVGKEAARTMLASYNIAIAALELCGKKTSD